jgi:hypothetical protein
MKPNHTDTGTTHGTTWNHRNGERGGFPPPLGGTTHTPNRNRMCVCGRCWSAFVAGKHCQVLRVAKGLQSPQKPTCAKAVSCALGKAPTADTVRSGWRR